MELLKLQLHVVDLIPIFLPHNLSPVLLAEKKRHHTVIEKKLSINLIIIKPLLTKAVNSQVFLFANPASSTSYQNKNETSGVQSVNHLHQKAKSILVLSKALGEAHCHHHFVNAINAITIVKVYASQTSNEIPPSIF